jgi:ABC-2 type transport system permease protein
MSAQLAGGLHLRAYAAFLRGTFHKMLAYRLRYVTGIVSYLVYVTTYYFLWKAAYAGLKSGDTIRGYTFDQMVTYVAIGWCARSFYFNNVDREIGELVQSGKIALELSRPVSFQGTIVAGALGEALFRLLFFNVPISAAIFLLFPVQPPASALHAAAFVLSLLFALIVLTHINFLIGMCAFPLKNIDGVMRAKHYLLELLSGLTIPVLMFPGWLQGVSSLLPFQAVSFVPTSIWLGNLQGAALARGLGLQLAWAIGLTAASARVWSRVTRRLTVQGG